MQRTKLLTAADADADEHRRLRDAVAQQTPDSCALAYFIMMLLGIGSLLPWNALITPIEYLKLRIAGSAFETSFESMFTSTFTAVSFLSLLAMQRLQQQLSLRARILGSLVLLVLVFAVLTACAIAPLGADEEQLLPQLRDGATAQFGVLMLCGALCGVGQAFLSGSAMAYASIFAEPRYLQAVSGGQGVAGLAVTLGSFALTASGLANVCGDGAASHDGFTAAHARDVIVESVVYFGTACVLLLVCVFAFLLLETLAFTKARKRLSQPAASTTPAPSRQATPGGSGGADGSGDDGQASQATPGAAEASTASINIEAPLVTAGAPADTSTLGLLRDLWQWALSICLIYVVTIAIFPSLTSTITAVPRANASAVDLSANASAASSDARSHCQWRHLFVPLGFVVFNLGDTVGRNLPCLLRKPNVLLGLTCARVAFAPLFMLCHTEAGGALQLPAFGGDDALALLIMAIFSVSNGWVTSSVFVASQSAIEPHRRNPAASLLVCMLNFGIAVGASLSFLVRYLDCAPSAANGFSCNPFVAPPLNVTAA